MLSHGAGPSRSNVGGSHEKPAPCARPVPHEELQAREGNNNPGLSSTTSPCWSRISSTHQGFANPPSLLAPRAQNTQEGSGMC